MVSRIVECLASRGDHLAVTTATERLSYAALAGRVATVADRLGTRRRLVSIEARNDIPTLVAYLGAMAGRHVVMPVLADRDHSAINEVYRPDVVVTDGVIREQAGAVGHRLHPELTVLLSTSGSTGSPKLVRLSERNLLSNADAIGRYLDIGPGDRAATTLPMSYSYGLSVINSHLLRGAGLILTDRSVVDDEFWRLFSRERGTNFAGVPYTFELLESIGFHAMDLPDLRFITQAGGRMPPDRVRRFAASGRRNGWQLFVMYGATEATARMAYLPADLAESHPHAIGRAIPGGSLTLDTEGWTEPGVGELVYRGPNVMMGYAQSPADLTRGPALDALRTGDIARRGPDGLFEVIGRRARFAKVFGLRIDLQRVETTLAGHGVVACCVEDDDRLVVATAGHGDAGTTQALVASAAGLPAAAVAAVTVEDLPRLPSGKPDYGAVRALAPDRRSDEHADLRMLFASVLGVEAEAVGPDSTFVGLGGDSLSYVAMSVRLERTLGRLPADWPRMTIVDLQRAARPRRRFGATLETSVALRAAAIILVVAAHSELFRWWGGAHVLLGVAGYNFGRFCLTDAGRRDRVRHLRSTIAWIAVPSIAWIALMLVVTDQYLPSNILLLYKVLGPPDHPTAGHLWFVEVLVYFLVALAVLLWVPAFDHLERRWPFGVGMAALAAGMAMRFDVFGWHAGPDARYSPLAFWFFALGWAAAKATTFGQRLAVTAVLAAGIIGYFGDGHREALVMAGLTTLIWVPAIVCPRPLVVITGIVADASLFIYLTHWQVYPLLPDPLTGVIASLAVGALLATLVAGGRRMVNRSIHPSATRAMSLPAANCSVRVRL